MARHATGNEELEVRLAALEERAMRRGPQVRHFEDCIRRLENEAAHADVPSWAEYEAAGTRQRARVLLSAFSKMPDEERSRRHLSKENRALPEGDSEEQKAEDRDVIARYEEANGVHYDLDALAEQARQKLREVGRSE